MRVPKENERGPALDFAPGDLQFFASFNRIANADFGKIDGSYWPNSTENIGSGIVHHISGLHDTLKRVAKIALVGAVSVGAAVALILGGVVSSNEQAKSTEKELSPSQVDGANFAARECLFPAVRDAVAHINSGGQLVTDGGNTSVKFLQNDTQVKVESLSFSQDGPKTITVTKTRPEGNGIIADKATISRYSIQVPDAETSIFPDERFSLQLAAALEDGQLREWQNGLPGGSSGTINQKDGSKGAILLSEQVPTSNVGSILDGIC